MSIDWTDEHSTFPFLRFLEAHAATFAEEGWRSRRKSTSPCPSHETTRASGGCSRWRSAVGA